MPTSSLYCDGSSHGRSGLPGGWAFVLVRDGLELLTQSGGAKVTTSNQMELWAALAGLDAVASLGLSQLELVSDSRVVLVIADGGEVPRRHAADGARLRAACLELGVVTRWVRGHSGDEWNERVDALARTARDRFIPARVKRRSEQRAHRFLG